MLVLYLKIKILCVFIDPTVIFPTWHICHCAEKSTQAYKAKNFNFFNVWFLMFTMSMNFVLCLTCFVTAELVTLTSHLSILMVSPST